MSGPFGNEKKKVAFYSILASIGMIVGKGLVGFVTGSLAIWADAVHSMVDLGASTVTFFAVAISDKPADQDHHFGHGKVESLAALFQVFLLLATCIWFFHKATSKLLSGHSAAEFSLWALGVIIVSIVIDVNRVIVLRRTARKYHSQALAADALNFYTDIFSSLVVLIGLTGIYYEIYWADAVAAIGVAIFIFGASLRMGKQAIDVLLDKAPGKTEEIIRQAATAFPEIIEISRFRERSDGRKIFVDAVLRVDRSLSFARANRISDRFDFRLKKKLPDVDITLSLIPASQANEAIVDAIRYAVSSLGLTPHHLIINHGSQGYFVSMHLEMPGTITLDEAHTKASLATSVLHESIDDLYKVIIHTEPHKGEEKLPEASIELADLNLDKAPRLVKQIVESFPGVEDCHNIILTPYPDGLALSADMRMEGTMTLKESHSNSVEVEKKLRAEIPQINSITLHLEPMK